MKGYDAFKGNKQTSNNELMKLKQELAKVKGESMG
ncbi:MAG: transposase [Glaciecola sp.]